MLNPVVSIAHPQFEFWPSAGGWRSAPPRLQADSEHTKVLSDPDAEMGKHFRPIAVVNPHSVSTCRAANSALLSRVDVDQPAMVESNHLFWMPLLEFPIKAPLSWRQGKVLSFDKPLFRWLSSTLQTFAQNRDWYIRLRGHEFICSPSWLTDESQPGMGTAEPAGDNTSRSRLRAEHATLEAENLGLRHSLFWLANERRALREEVAQLRVELQRFKTSQIRSHRRQHRARATQDFPATSADATALLDTLRAAQRDEPSDKAAFVTRINRSLNLAGQAIQLPDGRLARLCVRTDSRGRKMIQFHVIGAGSYGRFRQTHLTLAVIVTSRHGMIQSNPLPNP